MTHLPMAQALWPGRTQSEARVRDTLLVLLFSLVTALSAQITLLLPFSPVPVTGQTFAVLLSGALLGPRLGALSLLLYLAEGAVGLPFFAGGAGGVVRFFGLTAGYLLAYPLAAALVGSLAVRGWDRRPLPMLAAMFFGSVVIYAFGAAFLARFVGVPHALTLGVLPFLPGDAVKALLAAGLLPLGRRWIGRRT